MRRYVQVFDGQVMFAAELSDEDYNQIFNGPDKAEMSGQIIDVTDISPLPEINWLYDEAASTFSEPNLTETKTEKKLEVDVVASIRRTELGTAVRGQSEIYILKASEAQKYIADSYPVDLTDYPWIQMEVAATGLPPIEIADSIKNNFNTWTVGLQTIELERRKAKINIDNAESYADINIAGDNAIASINGLVF